MDKAKVIKVVLTGVSLLCGAAASLITNKLGEGEMKETVAKEVAKALADQAKES